jgi:hypothetical protein
MPQAEQEEKMASKKTDNHKLDWHLKEISYAKQRQ